MTNDKPKCEKHKMVMEFGDCGRCRGNGYTESDIEDLDDPLTFHADGSCYQCKGSGVSPFPSCETCDEEYQEELFND